MLHLLRPIKSKFQLQEQKILIKKSIRSANVDKNGYCKIYIEIISFYPDKPKKARLIDTGVKVLPMNFNGKKYDGLVTNKDPEYIEKNAKIDKIFFEYCAQLEDRELGTHEEGYQSDHLIKISDMFPQKTKNLLSYIEDYIEYRKAQNTIYNTLKKFTTIKNQIKNFDNTREHATTFSDINLSWADAFEYYLRKTGYKEGTIDKSFTTLVVILNHFYERREEMNIDLSDKFRSRLFKRGKDSKNEANPLTMDQLLTLYTHTFKQPHLEKTKLRFCWQCFTGLRYSDAFEITPSNIDNGWLRIVPQKTNKYSVEVNQPLNKYALEILEKLNNDTTTLRISNQVYNRQLEDLWPILIEKYPYLKYRNDYKSHSGRDTFISNCVEANVNWKSILQWVGQSSYEVMDRYIKNREKHQENEMKKLYIK